VEKATPDSEILEFAIARELEAHNFFMALAKRVGSREIAKVFEDLAGEELEHKTKLELEYIKTGRTLSRRQAVVSSDHAYVISRADAALDMDYKDVLLLGIEKEEASFRTYVNLIPNVSDEESREVLLGLAQEEVKHKLRFESEYELLLKKG
jgi:rubrerythrin